MFTACTHRTTMWSWSWLRTAPKEICFVRGGFRHSVALTTVFWPVARRLMAGCRSFTLRTSSWRWFTPSRWSLAQEQWHVSLVVSSRASPPPTPRKTPAAKSATSVWDVSCTCRGVCLPARHCHERSLQDSQNPGPRTLVAESWSQNPDPRTLAAEPRS